MSNAITNQVKYLKIGNPTAKAVLLALSDFSNDSGECYPSVSLLSEYTEFSPRAIKTGIELLELSGVLVVDRSNGRHNKYKIVPSNHTFVDQSLIKNKSKPVHLPHQCSTDTSAGGALTSAALPPTSAGGAPVPVQEVHTNHHITINEPSITINKELSVFSAPTEANQKVKRVTKKQAAVLKLVELGCEEKYASDWMTARKSAELTGSVLESLGEQAQAAGISIAKAVEWVAKKGYQGFKADWYLTDQAANHSKQLNPNKWDVLNNYTGGNSERDVTPIKKQNWLSEVGHA